MLDITFDILHIVAIRSVQYIYSNYNLCVVAHTGDTSVDKKKQIRNAKLATGQRYIHTQIIIQLQTSSINYTCLLNEQARVRRIQRKRLFYLCFFLQCNVELKNNDFWKREHDLRNYMKLQTTRKCSKRHIQLKNDFFNI